VRYYFPNTTRPLNAAKSLKVISGLKLSEAQEAISRICGYRDWHDLEQNCSGGPASPLDHLLSQPRRTQRQLALTARIGKVLGLDLVQSVRTLARIDLLHNQPERFGPNRAYRLGDVVVDLASGPDAAPGIVKSADTAVALTGPRGLALRGQEEVRPARPEEAPVAPYALLLAYGVGTEADGARVLFSRDYLPLYRLRDGMAPELCHPMDRIAYTSREWFWAGDRPPWRSRTLLRREKARLSEMGVVQPPRLIDALVPLVMEPGVQSLERAAELLPEFAPQTSP
tara:strand:+ start:69918 stop:70769 length:852 start_codon:yes stop_codon:yes gene_type:complete